MRAHTYTHTDTYTYPPTHIHTRTHTHTYPHTYIHVHISIHMLDLISWNVSVQKYHSIISSPIISKVTGRIFASKENDFWIMGMINSCKWGFYSYLSPQFVFLFKPRSRLSQVGSHFPPGKLWCLGSVALRHVGSSQTRDQACVPCIDRWILNHCNTREVHHHDLF